MRPVINRSVVLRGKAADAKAGAILLTVDDEIIYIDGLDYWPDELVGKEVEVKGELRRKKLIPDPVTSEDGSVSQGAEGEQLVLENADWRALRET